MDKEKIWRSQFPVLVCEAQERFSIAVIRSLGLAGYPVHACSPQIHALGFHSKFTSSTSISPPFSSNEFSSWLREYCKNHNIKCIIPTENLLLEIRPDFKYFKHLLPLSHDESIVYSGLSKFDLFQTLLDKYPNTSDQLTNLPPAILIEKGKHVPDNDSFRQLETPLFVKADGCHSSIGAESITQKVETVDQALDLVKERLKQFDKLLIQGFSPGVGVGVFLLFKQGRILAKFMHLRLHEIPIQGWSSYRKSWWHQEIYEDAEIKLREMNWEGVAMMEYRWNRVTNKFSLIEMNGRFWGSLHLALYAEVDFPAILVDAFHGSVNDLVFSKKEIYCRNTVLELKYVLSRLKDSSNTMLSKLFVMIEFIFLTINPRIKSDLFYPGDRKLFWLDLREKLLLVLGIWKNNKSVDSTKEKH